MYSVITSLINNTIAILACSTYNMKDMMKSATGNLQIMGLNGGLELYSSENVE